MAITVNRNAVPQRPLFAPLELVTGKSYRRSDSPSANSNYRDVIVVEHVANPRMKYLMDLKDFRLSPPDHESLHGLRFYEVDITINA
ncbi:hypothetical protein [Stenotrophomonas phage vB_SmeS_BUCT700]|uniref:Uncharacterized protein n=1 Tax=Stenotrophomonas phage vB_SmeS_BUCT700 TaxID=2924895 RepID=A0AAE9GCP4_9CAUD|nr:hypothetical protein [Stenotrophomonas phage vB_SmeS_BUCT700]UNY50299.1 hypothetical protein [Stenotrophomonas phage vB_SmeS_BUCT703]